MSHVLPGGLLLVPGGRRLAVRLTVSLAIPLVLFAVAVSRSASPGLSIFVALFLASQVAAVVTTSHKEMIAATPSWFQPGLRRRLVVAQLAVALLAAAVVVAAVRVLMPAMGGIRLLTVASAVLSMHAIMALAVLHVSWSHQLHAVALYLWLLVRPVQRLADQGRLDGIIEVPWAWLTFAAVLLWLLARCLAGPRLHRRLHGELVLGLEDIFRPARMAAHRQSRRGQAGAGAGPRWRSRLVGRCLEAAAAAAGRPEAVRRHQLQALCLASGISCRPWAPPLLATGTFVAMIWAGYFDGSQLEAGRGDRSLDGWFAGLLYQSATWPLYALAALLLAGPATSLSRRSGFRAECRVVWDAAVATLGSAIVLAVLFAVLGAVLPSITWDGREIAYRTPSLHGMWLAPLLAPFAWLGLALRPRPQSVLVGIAVGPAFVMSHALLSAAPRAVAVPLLTGTALAATAAAYALRRRWWERADLAH